MMQDKGNMKQMNKQRGMFSRRSFLMGSAITAGALASGQLLGQPTNDAGRTRPVLHLIGHSHIDAAWLWPWWEGSEIVLTTFRSALDRIKETPGFCYSHSSVAHYRWVGQADPQMFAEVRQRIREGRWEVVGGWPVEPDCNIPSTESFVRHSLYGKDYCQHHLGVDVKIGFNPDSFGHAGGLPTILKNAGYKYYVFMRPGVPATDNPTELPLLFWWEGADGSRILTLRIWRTYDAGASLVPAASKEVFAPGMDHAAFFLGVGDHGGAVTKEQIRQILELQKDPDLPELRFTTLREFFTAVEQSPGFASLPVVKNELQHHARGCYSANGEGKALNRRVERWLGQAEAISLVANLSADHAYPGEEYADAWWKVLFCQFHDMLAGSSLYEDYQDVRDSLGYACEIAQTSKIEALEILAKRVDLSGVEESAVFLWNPLPWPHKTFVKLRTDQNPSGRAPITHLRSHDGKRIPLQWLAADKKPYGVPVLSASVELPACGYKVFDLAHGAPPAAENYSSLFALSDSAYGITSLKADDGTELLSSPLGLVAISDTSNVWGHGIKEFRQEIGRPTFVSSTMIEDGPVMRVIRQRARWQDSEIVLDITQFAGMNFLELHFVIDWHEHAQILKLEIPTALVQPKIYARVPGEVIERRTTGEEEPYQDWAAVQGKVGNTDYTVALLNDSTYSYDSRDGLFRTVLVRSAPFASYTAAQVLPNDNHVWQDQGRQERRFWLMGGKGEYSGLALDRLAEEFQTPAAYVIDSRHPGTEAWENSFLEILPGNVWVLAIKRAEREDDATVIRMQDRSGSANKATLKSSPLGLNQTVDLAPWELKTLLVKHTKGQRAEIREVSSLEI
jgi:alpha-mannosidase